MTGKLDDLSVHILLDRSGSMQTRWGETVSGLNAYVEALGEDGAVTITVNAFDAVEGLDFATVVAATQRSDWRTLEPAKVDIHPRGMTPLFDAIGRQVHLMEDQGPKHAGLVILTDGAENASRVVTRQAACAALDRCRARGWDVTFIGADFDAFTQADALGTGFGDVLNARSGSMAPAMRAVARKQRRGSAFLESERKEAAGDNDI
jgi:Mg-chelatase subunit ChlD